MTFGTATHPDRPLKRNGINQLGLAFVWLTLATSAIVLFEPAPVDAFTFGLIILLPLLGLVAVRSGIGLVAIGVVIISAGLLIANTQVIDDFTAAYPNGSDFYVSLFSSSISIYLLFGALILSAFVALRPFAHTRLIFSALLFAGLVGAITGLVGYSNILPAATDLFTKFERASGTFKDPNVLGAFLVLPMIIAASMVLHGKWTTKIIGLLAGGLLLLAILLTFSRGAWAMLAVSTVVLAFLTFTTARTHRKRLHLTMLVAVGLLGGVGLLLGALQSPEIAEFFAFRAQTFQSYDLGPEGRFGGQLRALDVIIQAPLGIGSLTFVPRYHPENPHNIYIYMFLKSGWLGGFAYLAMIAITLLFGFGHALKRTPHQEFFQVAFAGFVGLAVIGLFIDTDHWRHFYVNIALVWGMMAAPQRRAAKLLGVQRTVKEFKRPARIVRERLSRNLSPYRRHRILGPARRRLRRDLAIPRRTRVRKPRRPQRIAYQAANDA